MKAKHFVIGFLAVVALIAVVSAYLAATVDRADKSVTALTSPDGKFKAVKTTITGGGATPFCVAGVSVFLAVYPEAYAESRREYEVYSAPCGKFADGEPSPKVEWQSNSALQITHVPVAAGAKLPKLRNIDVTSTVHVTFATRE